MIDAKVAPKVGFVSPFGTTVCNVNHINATLQAPPIAGATWSGSYWRSLASACSAPTGVSDLGKRFLTPLLALHTHAYLITSSARIRRVGGSVIPRACAVWRLMTNVNFVGCSTGKSAGMAPFRILDT